MLALGTFDGVHIGHAALIRRAHDIAADMGADCVVCTFDRHPSPFCTRSAPRRS